MPNGASERPTRASGTPRCSALGTPHRTSHPALSTALCTSDSALRTPHFGLSMYHPPVFQPRSEARELVLSPQEHLIAGGPAEQLEQLIQISFKQGVQRVFIDLRAVPALDSAGVRALVRGHTSAERLGRQFCLVAPNARVLDVLRLSHLRSEEHTSE